jgi:Arc/MetJ family transcription regulator
MVYLWLFDFIIAINCSPTGLDTHTPILYFTATHMKTTIDINDNLFARARRLAEGRGITLRALVEEGLHRALQAHEQPARPPFVLVTFGEGGLTPEAEAKGLHRVILDTYDQAYTPGADIAPPMVHDRGRAP